MGATIFPLSRRVLLANCSVLTDARAGRVEAGAAAAGSATTGNSATDMLTRTHRMTLDEARLILNLGKQKATTDVGAEKEVLLKVRCYKQKLTLRQRS